MHETHRQSAESHELAARAYRTAAEYNENSEFTATVFHSARALEYSHHTYVLVKETLQGSIPMNEAKHSSPDRFDVYCGMAGNRIGVARLDLPDFLPPRRVADQPERKV